ncbi:C163A protein, partial [Corythaixoides concolor]|nr:C163A protein [Corythaixoides concolor]
LRLVGGGSWCDGRVEIFQQGTWGRVLDAQWDVQEASMVCRQLRCGEAGRAYSPPKPERGTGPVGLRGVRCAGHEAPLTLCNTSLPERALAAGVAEDVGVICRGDRRVRLASGAGRCAGRVEIYYQGSWGTVCDDGWDLADAGVVCRQLGCGGAVEAAGSARFREGSGRIWLDGVNCSGAEAALWDCPAGPWGQHDCGHKEDTGVICSGLAWGAQRCSGCTIPSPACSSSVPLLPEFVALRLENSDGCSGRLQVFYNGTWGSSSAPLSSAPSPKPAPSLQFLSSGESPETPPALLAPCPNSTSCTGSCPSVCPSCLAGLCLLSRCHGRSLPSPDREKIRAVGGEDGCSGRVEVWHRGSWGTVCDDSWDMRDAEVACRQLGCGPVESALHKVTFGMGMGLIWLERVECRGTEPSLQDCWARPGDGGACRHKEDAAVRCSGERQGWEALLGYLTRGRLTSSGRVSVPILICIILGALLCLLLALLARQALSARAGRRGGSFHRGSIGRYLESSQAIVPADMGASCGAATTSPSALCPYASSCPLLCRTYLLPVTSCPLLSDVLVLPRGDPLDGYDDAREVSGPGEDATAGQGSWEMPRALEEG